VYAELGRLLAAIHTAPAALAPELLIEERARALRSSLRDLALDVEVRAELAASLEHPAWRPTAPRLVHGDAGLHNVLWAGRITALLDWEWAGCGEPLLDLAWVYWTMRWRDLPGRLWRTFLDAYGSGPAAEAGRQPGALRALALGQVAGILARSRDEPAAWAEWLRRAHWSLALAFPATF
jgi:aminoglycoside phosphotransferase (APT) family kinase protein